ncbi:CapA family protein [Candidatus Bathyarchaeota archaeon]|nr:CapA family protein [Candidatus Bathyarchaeota archaeon]
MPQQQVTFAAVGDIMFDHEVSKLMKRRGPDFPFLNVADELKDVDVVFGNLETPLTTCQKKVIWDFSKYGWRGTSKLIFLKGSPKVAIGLKNAGFNVVSIANNHILDYGIKGLSDTLVVLHKNGILPVGFGRNTRDATAPRLLEVKGVRFAFFACSWAYEATFFSPGVAPIRSRTLKKQVKKAREISDIIVVSLHLGKEFDESPSVATIRLTRSLIESGADIVLCHHPHVLQKIETYKKGLIAYSLGNFVFDYHAFLKNTTEDNAEKSRQSVILKCTLSKQGLISYATIPIQLNSEFQPTVVPRNSRLSQKIKAKVNAYQSLHRSSLDKKERKHMLEETTAIFNGLAVNLRRKKDLRSLYIFFEKTLDRLYSGNLF